MKKIEKSNKEWQEELDPEVYNVTRERGTEPPHTGKFYKHKENGTYICSNCGLELFSSNAKFDSGSGWPSFDDAVAKENVKLVDDFSHGMSRTEVICARCDAHLGHLFNYGYCVNSLSLDFNKKEDK